MQLPWPVLWLPAFFNMLPVLWLPAFFNKLPVLWLPAFFNKLPVLWLPAFFNKMPLRVHTGQIVERLSNLTLAYYTPPHPKQSGNPFPTRGERLSTVFLPFAPCGRRGRGMRGACVVTGDRSLNMNVWGNRIECCTGCRCINVDCPPIGGYKNLSNKSTHHRP